MDLALSLLLNLYFADPPLIDYVSGQAGETGFRWEHQPEEWRIAMKPVTTEHLEKGFDEAFRLLPIFNGTENRRLGAALSYFYRAVRLNICGDSPWEFMAETILNYAKCLDVLFVSSKNSKDDIRLGLEKLAYTKDEIEGDFIPIIVLRSWVDVAHPSVSIQKKEHLRVLHRYCAQSEEQFRELLKRAISKAEAGNDVFAPQGDVYPDAREEKDMNRLIAKIQSRLIQ